MGARHPDAARAARKGGSPRQIGTDPAAKFLVARHTRRVAVPWARESPPPWAPVTPTRPAQREKAVPHDAQNPETEAPQGTIRAEPPFSAAVDHVTRRA